MGFFLLMPSPRLHLQVPTPIASFPLPPPAGPEAAASHRGGEGSGGAEAAAAGGEEGRGQRQGWSCLGWVRQALEVSRRTQMCPWPGSEGQGAWPRELTS